jgi:uncharacterized protein YeaO (DUF488 family)
MSLRLKRVYEDPSKEDGTRILVDRLWPRGLTKEKARVDLWFKEIAPSNELRKWFAHDPAKWPEFKARYKAELKHNGPLLTLSKPSPGAPPPCSTAQETPNITKPSSFRIY